jgi:antitoxin VapB
MALSIKDEETDRLVRKLAQIKRLSYTQTIRLAVSNELQRSETRDPAEKAELMKAIAEIQARVAALPSRMTAEEVDAWMYDENGLPH